MARGPLTWRNITTDGGFNAASRFMDQAQAGMNQGFTGLDALSRAYQENQEANRQNTIENNIHEFRQAMRGLGDAQDVQAAIDSGGLNDLAARFAQRGGLGARFDAYGEGQTFLDSLRSRETAEHDHNQMVANRAADPVVDEIQARYLQGDVAGAQQLFQENADILRNARRTSEVAQFGRNTQRDNERYDFEKDQWGQTRAGWERDQNLRDAQTEADQRLNEVDWQADPYAARRQYFDALGNLPFLERIAREKEFNDEWSRRNGLSPEDTERLNNELQRLDAQYLAEQQHAQNAIQSYQAELDKLPTAIRNDIPQDGSQALLYLAEKFKIDRDYFTGNDIQKGFNDLVERVKKDLKGKDLEGEVNPYAIAIAAAERAITKQNDDGSLTINLRDPNFFGISNTDYTAQAYVDTVINELGGGRHKQHITTRDNLTRAIDHYQKQITNSEPNRITHRQKLTDDFRQRVRNENLLRGR